MTGATNSANYPTTPGAFDTTLDGADDAFVTKLNASGSALVYSTFLGGTSGDIGEGIAVRFGRAYVTGFTDSADYPTTRGAFDRTFDVGNDAFVTKLNASGSALAYSTFLGGAGGDRGFDIAVDPTGNAYVTGETTSSDYPTTSGAFDRTFNLDFDAFVTKLNASGSALVYSTFLGGTDSEFGEGIAVREGRAYVTGETTSFDYPTTSGAFDTSFNGPIFGTDAFVTKLNASGSRLAYSTFLGGTRQEGEAEVPGGVAIAVDGSGRAYVTGFTTSSDYPTTTGAFDTSFNGEIDAFVTKLNASGSALAYSTFLGGTNFDRSFDIAVAGTDRAYVTGSTLSSDYPTTSGAFDTTYNGGDAFVTKLPTG